MGLLGQFNTTPQPREEKQLSTKSVSTLDTYVNRLMDAARAWIADKAHIDGYNRYKCRELQRRQTAHRRFPTVQPTPELVEAFCMSIDSFYSNNKYTFYAELVFGHFLSVLVQESYDQGYNNFTLPGKRIKLVEFLHGTADNLITITFPDPYGDKGNWCTYADITFDRFASHCGVGNTDSRLTFRDNTSYPALQSKRCEVVFEKRVYGVFGAESVDSTFYLKRGYIKSKYSMDQLEWTDRSRNSYTVRHGAPLAKRCAFYLRNAANIEHVEALQQSRCEFYVAKYGGECQLVKKQQPKWFAASDIVDPALKTRFR